MRSLPEGPYRIGGMAGAKVSYQMDVLCMSNTDATMLEGLIIERGWGSTSRKGRVVTYTGDIDALFKACVGEGIRVESVEVMAPLDVKRGRR